MRKIAKRRIYLHFGSTYPVWQITAVCSDGIIRADMVQNRLTCEEQSENLEPLDNLIQARRLGRALRRQARTGLISYGRSLWGSVNGPTLSTAAWWAVSVPSIVRSGRG